MPSFLKFSQGQSAVNVNHIVSLRVSGRETSCQVIVTDVNGNEHKSEYAKSFKEAERVMNGLIDAMLDD